MLGGVQAGLPPASRQGGHQGLDRLSRWASDTVYDDLPGHGHRSSEPSVGDWQDGGWHHRNGKEYLAANPLFVPALRPILESSISDDLAFDPRQGAFKLRQEINIGNDLFASLPPELHSLIFAHLNSKDIAHLRLASRTFR
jgi:hypothetical protein